MTATNFAAFEQSVAEPLVLPRRGAPGEFIRYFLCSVLALSADMGLYWMSLKAGLSYPVAAAAGFCVGLFTAYTLSVRWAFSARRVGNQQVEFLLFAGIGLLGLGVTELFLWALIGHLGLLPLLAKAVTAGVVFFFNFGLRKALLFTRSDAEVKL